MVLLFCAVTQNKKAERPALSVPQHFRTVHLLSRSKDALKPCTRFHGG